MKLEVLKKEVCICGCFVSVKRKKNTKRILHIEKMPSGAWLAHKYCDSHSCGSPVVVC
jgi:hypothetical protein